MSTRTKFIESRQRIEDSLRDLERRHTGLVAGVDTEDLTPEALMAELMALDDERQKLRRQHAAATRAIDEAEAIEERAQRTPRVSQLGQSIVACQTAIDEGYALLAEIDPAAHEVLTRPFDPDDIDARNDALARNRDLVNRINLQRDLLRKKLAEAGVAA